MLSETQKKAIFRDTFDFYSFCMDRVGNMDEAAYTVISNRMLGIVKRHNSRFCSDMLIAVLTEVERVVKGVNM